jgi:catechol-2,3-dioxygenase
MDELKELYQGLKEHGATIDHTVDHGMTASVYFFDPDGNRIEFFCNNTDTAEEGLALMRSSTRVNQELVLN